MSQQKTKESQGKFKWEANHSQLVDCFVENGFAVVDSLFEPKLINNLFCTVSNRYEELKEDFINSNSDSDLSSVSVGISREIIREVERSTLFYDITHSENLLDCLERFLGPDLAKTTPNALLINDPMDKSPTTNKAMHQEVWTGSVPEDILVWIPLHRIEPNNTMSVIPGSHFFGLLPNRNRQIVCPEGFELPQSLVLSQLEEGDAVFLHPLLVHGTHGTVGKKTRYAIHFVCKSIHTPLSNQQKAVGYEGLRQGPMRRIQQILGNDYLTPLRTHGGKTLRSWDTIRE